MMYTLVGSSRIHSLVLAATVTASAAFGQASFTVIRPDAGYDYAVIQDVAGNAGSVLVSLQQSTAKPDPLKGYILDLRTLVRTPVEDGLGRDLNPLSINHNGSVVVGYLGGGPLGNTNAFVWTSGDGLDEIGGLPDGNLSYATGVSGDGLHVVGTTGANFGDPYQQGWRWDAANGFTPLHDLGTDILIFGSAEDISADGSTVVGFGSIGDFDPDTDDISYAAAWLNNSVDPFQIGNLPNPQPLLGGGIGSAASADGSVIVGNSPAFGPGGSFANHGWRWTSGGGLVDLGGLASRPAASITLTDVSADGNTAVGYAIDGGVDTWEGVVWNSDTGYHTLRQLLADRGVTIPSNIRLRESYCSADASVVAGWAYDLTTNGYVGYIARLPKICPCVADFDGSGGTPDSTDIAAFFEAWLEGAASADADCSGGTPDSTDIAAFFTQWLSGGC